MKFGPVPLEQAQGAILAHSMRLEEGVIRKGIVLTADHLAQIQRTGIETVIVAQIEEQDLHEDAAADSLAGAAQGEGLERRNAATGRVNLHAAEAGVLRINAGAVNAANRIDEALTIATPPDYTRLAAGQLAATAKVIPYGASKQHVEAACRALSEGGPALTLHPFRPFRAHLMLTRTQGMSVTALGKGTEAVRSRLRALSGDLFSIATIAHREALVTQALRSDAMEKVDLILILAASATADRADVAPAAIKAAGGEVIHFGMPVDPGNLLVLGKLQGKHVIVLPGCARSPALNGADWVLERVAAGLPISRDDIMGMGVGGLLKEIPSRPSPRERQS